MKYPLFTKRLVLKYMAFYSHLAVDNLMFFNTRFPLEKCYEKPPQNGLLLPSSSFSPLRKPDFLTIIISVCFFASADSSFPVRYRYRLSFRSPKQPFVFPTSWVLGGVISLSLSPRGIFFIKKVYNKWLNNGNNILIFIH